MKLLVAAIYSDEVLARDYVVKNIWSNDYKLERCSVPGIHIASAGNCTMLHWVICYNRHYCIESDC